MKWQGFTLLEVLISMAIIGVTFAVLAATQVSTLRVTSESRRASDATEFANRVLERTVQELLRDFPDFRVTCEPSGCVEGRFRYVAVVEPARVEIVGEDGDAARVPYLESGVMQVSVTVTEPANVTFTRVVSCMDVQPAPRIALPNPCPASGSP